MSSSKHLDKICCIVLCFSLLLTILFMHAESLGVSAAVKTMGYEGRLFDTSMVHTIDIVMEDWDGFLKTCTNEEYTACAVVIDGEAYKNVGIRAKGNTSLSQVASYGNDRYSFKIEFDQYDSTKSYYGLDKLCLNNIIQDNTYMKDYLVYQMMGKFGVAAPLCSYVYLTVNGEDFGLYLAVEAIEDAFLTRNYGYTSGNLYKPDSQNMGGGRGNGKEFTMEQMEEFFAPFEEMTSSDTNDSSDFSDFFGGFGNFGDFGSENQDNSFDGFDGEGFGDFSFDDFDGEGFGDFSFGGFDGEGFGDFSFGDFDGKGFGDFSFGDFDGKGFGDFSFGDFNGGFGSDDVSLIYSDDNYDSYSNIFENAKTKITDEDKERLIASLKSLNENTAIASVVNIEEVIRYFVVHNFAVNFDSYTGSMIHNYYLYEKDGQMEMIPWDYNLAFGGFMSSSDATSLVNYPIDTPVSGGSIDSRPMLAWIFENEEYTALYHQYFAEFLETFFADETFETWIDSVSAMIAPYIQKQPTEFCTFEEFEAGAATLKEFCLLRAKSIEGQLDGSIPSTSSLQKQDTSSLLDASHITISAMGSMNMGGQGGMGGPDSMGGQGNMDAPDSMGGQGGMRGFSFGKTDRQKDTGASTETKPPDAPNSNGNSSDKTTQEGRLPSQDMPDGSIPSSAGHSAKEGVTSAPLLLVTSALVLVAGIVFAMLYGRKR